MKRALLIAGGTVGGLGAVLSITPPQFGTSTGVAGGIQKQSSAPSTPAPATQAPATQAPATQAPAPATPTTAVTPAAKPAAKPAATKKAKPAATKAATVGASGTFMGDSVNTQFGPVQVQVTVSNGKITNVSVPVYPRSSGRDQQINSQAIPWLIEETMKAQSSNIQGVGGASYTSQGFYDSLGTALAKAGMK